MIIKPQFDKTGVLSEYPRPQKQRESYINLNGEWLYAFRLDEQFCENFDGTIVVPYSPESDFSTVKRQLDKNQFLHLKKTFTLPKGFNQGRVILNVGACDQTCKVYLNGELLHENFDGYTAFSVELTNILDGENVLYMVVKDDADSDVYGRGKQKYKRGGIWYTATSGIWQSVFLESVPVDYIKDFKYYIDFDNKILTVKLSTTNTQKPVYMSIIDQNEVISASGFDKIEVDISTLKTWSPESPELYGVVFNYDKDKVKSYFGVRKFSKIKVGDRWYFAINNKPVFLNGLLDQGYYFGGIYTPKTNEDTFKEILSLKNMGFNMLRKHIKIEPMLWYYYCDVLGMVVFQDMINGGAPYNPLRIMLCPFFNLRINDHNYKAMGRANLQSRNQYKYEANRLIAQLFNVTSLFLYTPFNEAWGQFDAVENYNELLKLDSTRLFDHASGWQDMGVSDVNSKHIYFRKLKLKNDGKRVLCLTEFGGYAYLVKGHTTSKKKFGYKFCKTREKFQQALQDLYLNQVIPMIKKQGLGSTCYTQVSDVEDEINGLYTYDRMLKVDPKFIKDINEKVQQAFLDTIGKN